MLKAVRTMLIVLFNILLYGLIVFAGIGLCRIGNQFARATVGDTSVDLPPGREMKFVVSGRESEYDVAARLAEAGMVRDRFSFYLRMQLEKKEGERLRPGTYSLNSSMTYEEIHRAIYRQRTDGGGTAGDNEHR